MRSLFPDEYEARASAAGSPVAATALFSIKVRFGLGLASTHRDAFVRAVNRWCRAITAALPPVTIDGETIDNLLVFADAVKFDGPGKVLGQAGPTYLRPPTAGWAAYLPAIGQMTLDLDDLPLMESKGILDDVIAHELGHVLGFGTVWPYCNLLQGTSSRSPIYSGSRAASEYAALSKKSATVVPVENSGGALTKEFHWRESVFGDELMTGMITSPGKPLSRMTIASFEDLGYVVDRNEAEPYDLPNLLSLSDHQMFSSSRVGGIECSDFLPFIPTVLPANTITARE